MLGLDGRVILVTGGSRGIGAAVVERLTMLGARVAYTCRGNEAMLDAGTPADGGALALHADVRDPRAMESAVEVVEAELGPIYGVVANAGITRDHLFPKMESSDWTDVMRTNLDGVFHTVRPVVPRMYTRNEGSLVFISSIIGERGGVGQVNYAASKAAVVGMAKALAHEGARFGVRSNVIAPGFIDTDMLAPVPDRVKEKILAEIPMRRFGQPDDIAWAVSFLLSPEAAGFITGAVLRVNGGHHT